MKEYIFVYKTTNLINGKFYIGVHATNKLDDGYLGSGKVLNQAIQKYGRDKFKREILFEFDNIEDAYNKESEIVTEDFCLDESNYNISLGGFGNHCRMSGKNHYWYGKKRPDISERMNSEKNPSKGIYGENHWSYGTIVVTDGKNNFRIPKNDPRYLSGELKAPNSGKITVKDSFGNCFNVDKNDPRYLSGELIPASKGVKKNLKVCENCGKKSSGSHFRYCGKK